MLTWLHLGSNRSTSWPNGSNFDLTLKFKVEKKDVNGISFVPYSEEGSRR